MFSSVLQIVLNRTVVSYFSDPLMFLVILSNFLFNLRHRELLLLWIPDPDNSSTLNLNLFSSHTSLNVSARVTRIEFHPMIPWCLHLLSCFSQRVSRWQNWHTLKKGVQARVLHVYWDAESSCFFANISLLSYILFHFFFWFYVALKSIYQYQQNKILQHKTLL